ncbi:MULTISPECIES: hypothetical protein [Nostocales]|uniref:Uncharacterized protein n=2 Tax=Nostocales TaxID=1161 RepID=A0A0C1NCY5_9CYAN|nr:hypothetical protein [Tolypothrix bouteillei]KAF3886590.1 hypothetical protein DA73_0400014720 [Tolypothrix bouteillei VB521301]
MNLASIDRWFPAEQQHKYISLLKGRVGVTRRRAEYFVKLWAYLLLKQKQELGKRIQSPLSQLEIPDGFVSCTHREAYEIFYGQQNSGRGSERAAGMMIDQLVALGLIEKDFDGNSTCIRVKSLPSNLQATRAAKSTQLFTDIYNPRTDTIPVASFLARDFNFLNKKTNVDPHRIVKILRAWAEEYPTGMRVLRRCDNQHPVGFYALHPIAKESEKNFFLPPRNSLFLLDGSKETDPLKIASLGDRSCICVCIRIWLIDSPYKQQENICLLLEDLQKTLIGMQVEFPNLCDMYTIAVLPRDEQLGSALGFQKNSYSSQFSSSWWMYAPVDKYLALNLERSLSPLKFD